MYDDEGQVQTPIHSGKIRRRVKHNWYRISHDWKRTPNKLTAKITGEAGWWEYGSALTAGKAILRGHL